MKRLFFLLALLLFPVSMRGHVGSPNVFFEGAAGPHPVRVVIRPPDALPGFVQVNVRAPGATRVAARAALLGAGLEAAPDAVEARPVPGDTNLFNAAIWLLFGGSYSIHVSVEGPPGAGTAVVPLSSAAIRSPAMPAFLQVLLAGLGTLLFVGVVWWCGIAARDGLLAPEKPATHRDRARGRRVSLLAAVLLAGAVSGVGLRWRSMDREFRDWALAKPVPVAAAVRTNGTLRLLHLTPQSSQPGSRDWTSLMADHGKLMHLFLVREPDFDAFAHLHPVRRDARNLENLLPPMPPGNYQLYGEVTHEDGVSQTLTARVSLPAPSGRVPQVAGLSNDVLCLSPPVLGSAPQPFALDADDSWHTGATPPAGLTHASSSPLMGGLRMQLQLDGELVADRETQLRFAVFDAAGKPATLQPYMGMMGHAVVRRTDGEVFTHLHPVGSISMAAQELFLRVERSLPAQPIPAASPDPRRPINEVAFPYAFPRPGDYRMWVQVRIEGRILTGVFGLRVKPERRR